MSFKDYVADRRILLLIVILASLAVLDVVYGIHFGIEFIGGTQIPITLATPVNPEQMSNLTNIITQRASTFGLKEVTVEGIGNDQIYVIIPSVSGAEINATINIIDSQGIFDGIVNGRDALNGTSILSGSIGAVPAQQVGTNVSWAVNFYVTSKGAKHFANTVFGQANQPIYMFLDRPANAILLLNTSLLSAPQSGHINTYSQSSQISAMSEATAFGNQTIPIELLNPTASNWNSLETFFASHNTTYHKVILASSTPQNILSQLKNLNYTVVEESNANMTPQFVATGTLSQTLFVNSWPAIGLLSAPILSPDITNGSAGLSYEISGYAPTALNLQQKAAYANNQSKTIASILSGGALPVHVIVNTPTTIKPTLGSQFLLISGVAALLAIIAVAIFIMIRYRNLFLILPILLTTFAELFIIVSIIGLIGTIDLAAVAGMIAVVGTGVDAQIIITDEVLQGNKDTSVKSRFGNAFNIIWINAGLLILAMLPLLFSTSLVTIVGFAESTILGALLGVLITRPAYGAIIRRRYESKEQHDNAVKQS